jgi:hypothetical protein
VQPDSHPKLLGLVLQSDLLKLESCKFNIIINIINITFGLSVAIRSRDFGYTFAEIPKTLRS